MTSTRYVAAAFSPDERMLAAQGGPPDWTLVLYLLEKGKVFSVLRLSDTPGLGPVTSVLYHLEDSGVLSVVGERVVKLLKLNDKLLKTWGYQGGHNHNCHCQVWADQHTLLIGTDVGSVLLLEEGELRTELKVSHPHLGPECDKRSSGEGLVGLGGRGPGPRHRRVTALAVFHGGFLCACGPDKIFVFQKSEDINEHYIQRFMMRLCEASPASVVSGRGEHTITVMSLSPGEKTIVAATHTSQIFTNPLPSLEPSKLPSLMFTPLHAKHHEGSIVDADACLWKPVVVTAGQDRTVRVWDYQNHNLLLSHAFREDIFSLSVHPSGLHVAVGMTDALRLVHVLFDCLRTYTELKIRRCAVISFSPSGHMLAAADGNLLVITSSVTFKKICTLKGHSTKVTGIGWYPDSSAAITCGVDGYVVAWDILNGVRLWEVGSITSPTYLTSTLSLDNHPTLVTGCGASCTEITEGEVVQEIPYGNGDLICVDLAPVRSLIALGTSSGKLVMNKFPLHLAESFTTTVGHFGPVVKAIVTSDEGRVVTCGGDGVVVVWKITMTQEETPEYLAARERVEDLPQILEMLVSREDLKAKREYTEELERRVSYLARDKEVHLGLQQQEFAASKDALVARYNHILDQMNDTIQTLEKERETLRAGQDVQLKKLMASHDTAMAEHQQELRQKLLYEYSKQDKLEVKLKEVQRTLDRRVQEAERKTRQELQLRLDEQVAIVHQLTADLEKTCVELERERSEGAEIVRLVEAATEAELGQVRQALHSQLAEEHTNVIKLRSERAALTKNYATVQRECEQKDMEVKALGEERSKLNSSIRGLERELAALRKEVNHRDDVIHDRESKITTTRERIGELEKQRFLLEHQLNQLKEELEPLQTALDQRSQQIKQLEDEMTETRLVVGARDRQVKELSQRLVTSRQLSRHLQQRHHSLDTTLTRVLADVAAAAQMIHHPKKLKELVKSLNDRYVRGSRNKQFWTRTELDKPKSPEDSAMMDGGGPGEEAVPELLRQREMLERSVATLRAQAQKQTRAHKDKLTKLVQENSELLESVRQLEERCWRQEEDLKQAESMAGLRDPRSGKRRASRDYLIQTVTRQADTIARLQEQIRVMQGNPKKDQGRGPEIHMPAVSINSSETDNGIGKATKIHIPGL
ncbi:cilia- and flagella-associated protein 57 [Palaemon carinicauda]|uniref:cilia- and flagella-associated protein 57 n=1 Tax=Palaemon carinicauda TaxID=392227 RepID=UPI0035B5D684